MENTIIVNIRNKTFTPEEKDIINLASASEGKFKYKFIPVVVYNKKTLGKDNISTPLLKSFNKLKPFSLYELGTPIAILKTYMGDKIKTEDLKSAKKAFKSLRNFSSQCYERIIADLSCQVIMEELRNLQNGQHLIFFIEKSASDKMLGRLASLYLNLEKATICFLSYGPSDLMTTVMSHQTGKLSFDIHRLMTQEITDFIGPYPGDFEDSLTQTYFYKPLNKAYLPFRIDIFAQGLLIDKIEKKKDMVKKIFEDSANTEPDITGGERDLSDLMPFGFNAIGDYLNQYLKEEIKQRLLQA